MQSYAHFACYYGPLSFILTYSILYDSPYLWAKSAQSTIVVFFIIKIYVEVSFRSMEIGIRIGG